MDMQGFVKGEELCDLLESTLSSWRLANCSSMKNKSHKI